MAPSVPRTRDAAVLRMKQIALDNQSRMPRRLRAKLATERRESAATLPLTTKATCLDVLEPNWQPRDESQLLSGKDWKLRYPAWKEIYKSRALEASHKTIAGLTEIGLCMSKKIERMKAKKQQARESHMECHKKLQARIQEAEDTIQEQKLIIEALVEDKASLLQTIQGLQEDNDAPPPFDDEWEEELEEDPEEEGIEDIPIGEGDIVDE
ncbi:hypothetical protein F511_36432 [Dorcoceras hygrometricum]|uniref:Uncharacterized protein n=1 Tax=Dorcoceras hygrometricum TaxID=472368 RepID=A0A2Z7AC18_9LAMI|nr:hypothetical protein F511_36432 [Dorcoceras hygrometricum]